MPASQHHPRVLEDCAKKELKEKEKQDKKSFVGQQTEKYHLRFCHVRLDDPKHENSFLSKGGCTIAFQLPKLRRGRIINVSCALVNENDTFYKLEGRFQASKRFNEGKVIQLRVPKGMLPSQFLKNMFWYTA